MLTSTEKSPATTGAMPGLVFTGCDSIESTERPVQMMAAAGGNSDAQTKPAAKRRVVKIGRRRVKTIDVHCHCVIPEALALLGLKASEQRGPGLAEVGARRIREMDEDGIDVEALSINPNWYGADREFASEVVRINNDRLAEICATYPDRFVAFASLSLQFPELAVQQLQHAVKNLGLRGAAVGASCAGEEFSDSKFHPVWAKAEELGVLVFIHPQSTPELAKRFKGNGWLSNTIGNPLDTTICLSHLIFEGTLDRFPGLKICAAHGGGYLPSYAPRSDHACRVGPDGCNPAIHLKKKPTEYLRGLYFDTLVFTSEMLRHLAAEVGTSQLVIGTDHPIPWSRHAIDHVLETPGLTNEEKVAILGGTAAKLLNIR